MCVCPYLCTVITLFWSWKYFGIHLLFENLLLEYYSDRKFFFAEGSWLMVIPTLYMATVYLALTLVAL